MRYLIVIFLLIGCAGKDCKRETAYEYEEVEVIGSSRDNSMPAHK